MASKTATGITDPTVRLRAHFMIKGASISRDQAVGEPRFTYYYETKLTYVLNTCSFFTSLEWVNRGSPTQWRKKNRSEVRCGIVQHIQSHQNTGKYNLFIMTGKRMGEGE